MTTPKRLIVLSAPSGAGKTTVARHLLSVLQGAMFSVSATTRAMRTGEVHGKDYYFLTNKEFELKIASGDLIEYEQIFGNYYGTLRSSVEEALKNNKVLLFDVDVKGALSLRREFPNDTLLMFIAPPSREILEERLRTRSTESDEQIALRLSRADMEMAEQHNFDVVIINGDLNETLAKAEQAVRECVPINV
jgi:guanylate kinase